MLAFISSLHSMIFEIFSIEIFYFNDFFKK